MHLIRILLTLLASTLPLHTWAATLAIPHPYVIYLLDGQPVKSEQLSSKNHLSLAKGEHQLVIRFEGSFRDQGENRLISGEPVVYSLSLQGDESLALEFSYPRDYRAAEQFLKNQQLKLIDTKSGKLVNADYFVMPKKEGLQIGRNYQEELQAMGKAFGLPQGAAVVATAAAATASASPVNATTPNNQSQSMEMLKYWYLQADSKTRKEFQHWIISQQ